MRKSNLINAGLLSLFASAAPLVSSADEATRDPRALFRQALAMYEDEKYQEGVDLLALAKEHLGEPPTLDRALIHYNTGIGYYRLSQPEKAAVAFQEALQTPDIETLGKAYFNLGNARYQVARQALDQGDVANAFKLYQAAASNYVEAMRFDSTDRDAKINYELSLMAQTRILQMVAMAMRHMKQGDQLVGEYRFAEAAAWFQQNFENIEKALTLEPDVKKQFEQMAKRTSSVAEISNPAQAPESGP